MASNELPNTQEPLFTLAEDMADGLNTYEVAVGVKQNLEATMRTALTDAQTAVLTYDDSRSTKTSLGTAQTVADSNGKAYLGAARAVLTQRHGNNWSDAWLPTGFPNNSTAVPRTIAERQALLYALNAYFVANPTYENVPLNVTAAQALSLGDALSAARSAVNDAASICGQNKNLRDAAVLTLRKRMRGLIDELGQLLEDDDPRWNAFGLNPPASSNLPDIPDAPILTAGTPGTVLADWVDAPRADHYRVFKKVVGVDTDYVFAQTVTDSDATLSGLPHGATVDVRISAVNAAGESQPSTAAQIIVP